MVNYSSLPNYMRNGARLYIEEGVRPGSFMTALLSNQLMEAFGRADETNQFAMVTWVRFLYNEAPGGCYGSPQHFENWIKDGGVNGRALAISREL